MRYFEIEKGCILFVNGITRPVESNGDSGVNLWAPAKQPNPKLLITNFAFPKLFMAERVGFEPTVTLRLHTLSRRA
jgi:hypothetical protein